MATSIASVGGLLRSWRELRRLSQLDLALEALRTSSWSPAFNGPGVILVQHRHRPSAGGIERGTGSTKMQLDCTTILGSGHFPQRCRNWRAGCDTTRAVSTWTTQSGARKLGD